MGPEPTVAQGWGAGVRLASGILSGQNDPDPSLLQPGLFDGGHHTRELRIGRLGRGCGPQLQIATRGDVKKRTLGEATLPFHPGRRCIQTERCATLDLTRGEGRLP